MVSEHEPEKLFDELLARALQALELLATHSKAPPGIRGLQAELIELCEECTE